MIPEKTASRSVNWIISVEFWKFPFRQASMNSLQLKLLLHSCVISGWMSDVLSTANVNLSKIISGIVQKGIKQVYFKDWSFKWHTAETMKMIFRQPTHAHLFRCSRSYKYWYQISIRLADNVTLCHQHLSLIELLQRPISNFPLFTLFINLFFIL